MSGAALSIEDFDALIARMYDSGYRVVPDQIFVSPRTMYGIHGRAIQNHHFARFIYATAHLWPVQELARALEGRMDLGPAFEGE